MRHRTRVRFNLGKGGNYMKWRILRPDGSVEFLEPDKVQLIMTGCTFKNSKRAAQKIYDGANKTVCAWVLCDELRVETPGRLVDTSLRAQYNPRVTPNWTVLERDVDNDSTGRLHTIGSRIYVTGTI